MKVKIQIKAKASWSQLHRDVVLAATEFAVQEHNLWNPEHKITVRLCGSHDAHQGSMARTTKKHFIVWMHPCRNMKVLLETIFHEMTHVKQAVYDGWELHDEDNTAKWKGKKYHNVDENYWKVPWEVEARRLGRQLTKRYMK